MSTSQGEAASADEHVAPPEAWDAIALGYDRYVAPQEVDLAKRRSASSISSRANGSSTSRRGQVG